MDNVHDLLVANNIDPYFQHLYSTHRVRMQIDVNCKERVR